MKVVITGGAGFIGRQLAERLLALGELPDRDGKPHPIDELVLFDAVEPAPFKTPDKRVRAVTGDIADRALVARTIDGKTGSVFHLAAVVSAAAEADFDLGMRVNVEGTQAVLEACRALPQPARLVFTSSIAVFGGDMPPTLIDTTPLTPQTSYGAQKAIGELLLNDYSRKGFIDGRALRLPTIVVRPGKPNKAASTFASSILREPLAGQEAICPVERSARMWILSPRRAVEVPAARPRPAGRALGHQPQPDAAGHRGQHRRHGRRPRPRRRQGPGRAHQMAARRPHPEDRRRLALPLRPRPRQEPRLLSRQDGRRHHPVPHRRPARRQGCRLASSRPYAALSRAFAALELSL